MGASSAANSRRDESAREKEAPLVSVVVPATTANLGCAFDCAGIALNIYLRAGACAKSSPGISVSYEGTDAARVPQDPDNLVVQSMRRAAERCGRQLPFGHSAGGEGLAVHLHSEIPVGTGFGSSAAAIVAGVILGSELCGQKLGAAELIGLAMEIENHPDNLAAALHGGMVVSAVSETKKGGLPEVLIARTPVSGALDFIAIIPETPLPTAEARAVLPASYSRQDVVANLQRTAVLTAAFFSGRGLAPEIFRDRLHQPYRSGLVPGIAACLEYRHQGLAGVFLSGAGSAVMAISDRDSAAAQPEIVADLTGEFTKRGIATRVLVLKADNSGTRVASGAGERLLSSAAQSAA